MKKQPEIWKDIINYENYYQISNHGRVKSLKRTITNCWNEKRIIQEKILIPNIMTSGYYEIFLSKKHKRKVFSIHRLVAIYFIDNSDNKLEVNHKDGIKLNNYYENLEWMTSKENIQHAINIGTHKVSYNKKNIKVYDSNNIFIKEFNSRKEAAEWRNVSPSTILRYYKYNKDPNGYVWKYIYA